MSEEEVRAPMERGEGVMTEDSFADTYGPSHRVVTGSVFDAGRDFKAEAARQRARLEGAAGGSKEAEKLRTLSDLFRPPHELIFDGGWEAVREAGKREGKWLLVNLQSNTEFACQALNRDVWNHGTVQQLVQANFVFWQVTVTITIVVAVILVFLRFLTTRRMGAASRPTIPRPGALGLSLPSSTPALVPSTASQQGEWGTRGWAGDRGDGA